VKNRRHERGSALVLAVLILFAMLGLGMLAMRSATQNIAGSGNLRLAKQARYVAEVGLHHAIKLMEVETDAILLGRSRAGGGVVTVNSAGNVKNKDGEAITVALGAPPVLSVEPPALGAFQAALVPSYEVTLDGFKAINPVGNSGGGGQAGFCRVEYTSRGFVASEALPDLNEIDPEERLATSSVKATVVVKRRCP